VSKEEIKKQLVDEIKIEFFQKKAPQILDLKN